MRKNLVAGLALAAGIAVLGGAAFGQGGRPGPGGRPGGPGGGPGGRGGMMGGMVFGTVQKVDAKKRTVLVKTNDQGLKTVRLPANMKINQLMDAKAADLRKGDQVMVSGVPTTLDARSVTMTRKEDQDAPPPAPGGRRGPGQPGGPPSGAFGGVNGTVASVKPLVVTADGGVRVTVVANAQTRFLRRAKTDLRGLKTGEGFVAAGVLDQSGVLDAQMVGAGKPEELAGAMRMMGGGRGFGRRGMGPGGPMAPGGGRPGPPR